MSRADFEYCGIHTALNGLLNWLYENVDLQGNADQRCTKAMNIIVAYGKANIRGYVKRGHLQTSADFVARKVHKNKKFHLFTNWVISTHPELLKQKV
jgi:hypothetical protein